MPGGRVLMGRALLLAGTLCAHMVRAGFQHGGQQALTEPQRMLQLAQRLPRATRRAEALHYVGLAVSMDPMGAHQPFTLASACHWRA
jgi:hypothetical protein